MEGKSVNGGTIIVTAPGSYVDGYINVSVSDGNGHTSLSVINFYQWQISISGQEQEQQPTYSSYTLTLNVAENASASQRSSTVQLYSEDGNTLLATLDVAQLAVDEGNPENLVFTVSANIANSFTVYLPISPYNGTKLKLDCIIDWGDGTQNHIIRDYSNYDPIFHEYANLNSATEFEVRISGTVPSLSHSLPKTSVGNTISAVKQWGKTQLVSISDAFSGMTFLKSIADDYLVAFTNVKNFNRSFADCTNLTDIPAGLFKYCTNATDFDSTFSQCTTLTSIPADLFKDCTNATYFNGTFSGCTALTSIPADLFKDCTNVMRFEGTFKKCTALTSIPANLFDNNQKILEFSQAFYECESVIGESPYTIINDNKVHLYERYKYPTEFVTPSKSDYSCFYRCTGLSDYDNIPNDWKSK